MDTPVTLPVWKRFNTGFIRLESLKTINTGTHDRYKEYKSSLEKGLKTRYVIGNFDGYTEAEQIQELYEPLFSISQIDATKGIIPSPYLFSIMKLDTSGRGKFHSMDQSFVSIDKAYAKGFFIVIKESFEQPLVEFVKLTEEGGLLVHHDVIELKPQTHTIILRVVEGVGKGMIADNVEIFANQGSSVDYVTVNKTKKNGFYSAIKRARLSGGANVNWYNIDMDESNIAISTRSILAEPGSETRLIGVVVGKGDAQKDISYETFHTAPDTTTSVLVRAAVLDQAKVIYRALTHITSGSKRAKVEQAEKSIMLGEHARFDGIPSLWIDEDNVIASHSASSGMVDEQTMFYLKSRGIPHHIAEKLITDGFIGSLLNTYPINLVNSLSGS
ncbi:MAG: SufD family Fe-S cluster assembly protein [bacterium]